MIAGINSHTYAQTYAMAYMLRHDMMYGIVNGKSWGITYIEGYNKTYAKT